MIFYYLGLIFFIIYFIEKLIIIYFPESFSRNIFFWNKNAYTGNPSTIFPIRFKRQSVNTRNKKNRNKKLKSLTNKRVGTRFG